MPIKIKDSQISSAYNKLQAQNQTMDDNSVLDVLAGAGDSSSKNKDKVRAELARPGITRAEQVALVQKGMSKTEKADLGNILDKGTVPMTASARKFIEEVLGRTAPQPNADPLKITVTGDQKNGIAGIAGANVTIEAINLSTAPEGRLHTDDTMVIGKTDQFGKFMGNLPDMKEGDVIRMRARDASGKVGEWVTLNAKGVASTDTRNAQLAIFRIGLTDLGGGKIGVENINASRPMSEPGARIQFTNARTGEKTVVTCDGEGQMPAGLTLKGQAGDTFRVATTDGKNNTSFSVEAGKVTVPGSAPNPNLSNDLPDPALHKDELDSSGKPRFSTKRFSGPLFKDGPSPGDVQQGQIGDCYFPAAMAAIAQVRPDAIQKMMKDNGDGTYTVTFKERDWRSGGYKDVQVKVDGDLYVRSWGGPLYGATNGPDKGEKTMELWFPIVEKAYAQWKGSYNTIGNGGVSSQVIEDCLGLSGTQKSVEYMSADQVWNSIKDAIDNKRPCAAGTHGEEENARYTNSGIYADHAYTIMGYKEKNGERYVTMRNPWGESEPAGNGANDGIFDLKLADFQKYYQTFMTVR